jgi:rhodanese-related sulfurtransferase
LEAVFLEKEIMRNMNNKVVWLLIPTLAILAFAFKGMDKDFEATINRYVNFSVDTISAPVAHKLVGQSGVHWVDTRSTKEYNVSRIEDAFFVNYDHPNILPLKKYALSDTLIVYCTVGYRSEKIAEQIKALGFKNVYNLYGGILSWANHNFDVQTPRGTPTNQIHTYDKSWGVHLKNPNYTKISN